MKTTIRIVLFVAAALVLVACDTVDDGDGSGDDEIAQNNQNGYCWAKPKDCSDLVPLEDDLHYHCCFDTKGFFCDDDGDLRYFSCSHSCRYDDKEDRIYCAFGPSQGSGGCNDPIPPGAEF